MYAYSGRLPQADSLLRKQNGFTGRQNSLDAIAVKSDRPGVCLQTSQQQYAASYLW
ncbi:hypothetical protein H6S82_15155 [Planktothrix sp. FACHB-1355]|uniref:Uncharacterized protein n=1 Tax=Aerosakkonema funiforme FACHB-1375 TaxID=2949571 RepID=A0A926ZFX4_9CYAN|nr:MULTISPECIES: hypothetical protein [Oscillatoriales]MBD2181104.1 hypothetical protein [Aerosakkonema funiforme FACHB-1375]MBD3560182.1 hypothetical protein [Planktothrix sp. FACHB-1355]